MDIWSSEGLREERSGPHMELMDRTELAWAAGFWDGEGSAYLTGSLDRVTRHPQARINQSSLKGVPQVLVRFRDAVGSGRISGPEFKEGRQPLYRWVASSRSEIVELFACLGLWLGPVKRRQFARVLELDPDESVLSSRSHHEELAWAAGLFDGEGSVYLAKHRTHEGYVRLESAITQSDASGIPAVLSRFEGIVGIGTTKGPYPAPPGHDPVYRWKAHRAHQIVAMVEALRPWLGDAKREQADLAHVHVSSQAPLPRGNPAWGSHKTHCARGHEYATARLRLFRGRGKNAEAPRASHQCLACVREDARSKQSARRLKNGG